MIGARHVHEGTLDAYFNSFCAHFGSPEKRFEAATTLLPGSTRATNWGGHFTRTVLAAQWGDTRPQAKETAKTLYSLPVTLAHYAGQRVVQLTHPEIYEEQDNPTTLKGIQRAKHDGTKLQGGFELAVGAITPGAEARYAFKKTPSWKVPLDASLRSRFLDFAVSFPVSLQSRLDVDPTGDLMRHELVTPMDKEFVAYAGTVCLDYDEGLYRHTRKTAVGDLAFGSDRAYGVVYDTLKAFGDYSEFDALKEELAS